ncbi:MAG TPA: TIGR03619 family F420-dependent LLM class oxidoreductase [Acidimicrobiales bacterium]|nr:TIGR03619 family F420-dependent LLM class oxidoreductase [Acidimicrobiales bacterium]
MRFWLSVTFVPTELLPGIAVAAEEAGFTGLALGEHLVVMDHVESRYPYSATGDPVMRPDSHFPDPLVTAAALGAATTRLRFLTSVYVLPLREPLAAAKAVATAAVLTGDRLELGIGAGWLAEEFAAAGQDFSTRGRRTDEMVEILQALLAGGPVEHHGELVDFPLLQMAPVPERPVPLYVGGHTPAALRRAAALDGWIGIPRTDDELPPLLDALREARRKAGTLDRPFVIVVRPPEAGTVASYRALAGLGVTDVMVATHQGMGSRKAGPDEQRRTMRSFMTSVAEVVGELG